MSKQVLNNKLIWKIHSWTGLYTGIVIAFLSITGAAALFREELDRELFPSIYFTDEERIDNDISVFIDSIRHTYAEFELFEVIVPEKKNGSWMLRFLSDSQPRLWPVLLEVFIDPSSLTILEERNYYKTFNYYLRNIHVRFYEGFYGRQIVGLAGIALLISTITGLLIYGKFMARLSFWQLRKKNIRTYFADLHKLIGILSLVFNLIIAITGAWLGLQPYLQKWLDIERPNTYNVSAKPFDKGDDLHLFVDYQSILSKASQDFPELHDLRIRPSRGGEGIITILGNVNGQVFERNSNKLVYTKGDESLLYNYCVSNDDTGAKLFYIQEALHFGDFAGLWLKILYAIFGLTSGFLAMSGFIIYLKRNEKKKGINVSRQLWVWSLSLLIFCLLICFLSLIYGIGIPTLIVSVLCYVSLLIYILFLIFRFFQNMIKTTV